MKNNIEQSESQTSGEIMSFDELLRKLPKTKKGTYTQQSTKIINVFEALSNIAKEKGLNLDGVQYYHYLYYNEKAVAQTYDIILGLAGVEANSTFLNRIRREVLKWEDREIEVKQIRSVEKIVQKTQNELRDILKEKWKSGWRFEFENRFREHGCIAHHLQGSLRKVSTTDGILSPDVADLVGYSDRLFLAKLGVLLETTGRVFDVLIQLGEDRGEAHKIVNIKKAVARKSSKIIGTTYENVGTFSGFGWTPSKKGDRG